MKKRWREDQEKKKQKLDHPKNLFQIESNIHFKKKIKNQRNLNER